MKELERALRNEGRMLDTQVSSRLKQTIERCVVHYEIQLVISWSTISRLGAPYPLLARIGILTS